MALGRAGRTMKHMAYEARSTPTSVSTRLASILLVGSMIGANSRSRIMLSAFVADSNPKIRYVAHFPSHRWVICEDVIGSGSDPAGAVTPRSSTA